LDEGSAASFSESVDVNSYAVFRYSFVVLLYCRESHMTSTGIIASEL
jgi:hypothetical protein